MTEPYQDILSLAGFPTQGIVLDFETYFDAEYSLAKMSGVEYVMDPRFEVLGLGYQTLGANSQGCGFLAVEDVAGYLATIPWDQYTVVGQNLKFDALVLRERYGVTPPYMVDILDLARHLDARDKHDLNHLAHKYHAPTPKGDTKQFSGLHWATMTGEQRQALSDYCLNDVAIETFLFKSLLPRLTWPAVELRLALQTLRQYLVPNIKINADLGKRLIVSMQARLQEPVDRCNTLGIRVVEPPKINKRVCLPPKVRAVTTIDVSKDKTFLALLQSSLPAGESIPMKQGKKRLIPALAKTDTQLDYLLTHPSEQVRALMESRKATDSWPTHISRVQKLMAQAAARGGYMGAPLTYYGAHTGRWSGAGGVNFQNFGARDVDPLVKQVGQMLTAPDGGVFGTGDLSQIEARVVAWFAAQEDLLEDFRRTDAAKARGDDSVKDVYCRFAEEHLYHAEVRKPRKDDPPELVAILKTRRDVGKETILGAGYGMGGGTFYTRCKQKPSLKDAFASGELTMQLCQQAIAVYRQRYSMIPKFWQEVEKAWRFVARYSDQSAVVSHGGRALRFWNECRTVVVQLPSSRCLYYPHARVDSEDNCSYRWGKIYGGALTENVVQATARDVFAEGLLRLEDAGFVVVFTVHDQAITLMPIGDTVRDDAAKAMLAEMHRLQCIVPVWAKGLPVAVEGELCEAYHK